MGNAKNIAACHRFRDELGLTVCDANEGATVYLSLKQARELRAAVSRIVRSIEREKFSDSAGLTFSLSVRDQQTTHAPTIDRS